MRIYAIGDIHGRYDLMYQALNVIYQDINDLGLTDYRIVFLGDYVDRGAESFEVIETLIDTQKDDDNVICLMGNHERMMIEGVTNAYTGSRSIWYENGGIETMESYGGVNGTIITNDPLHYIPDEHLAWLKGLKLSYETDHYFFVHAGINPDLPLDRQKEKDLLWIRWYFLNTHNRPLPKHVVHGHTPHQYDVERRNKPDRRTNLDSGAVWTNVMMIGIFDDAVKTDGPIGYIQLEGTHDEIEITEIIV